MSTWQATHTVLEEDYCFDQMSVSIACCPVLNSLKWYLFRLLVKQFINFGNADADQEATIVLLNHKDKSKHVGVDKLCIWKDGELFENQKNNHLFIKFPNPCST